MKPKHFVDTVGTWLGDHALSVTIIVVVTIVVLKVAAVLNRKLFGRLFADKRDEDSQKLAHTITIAVHWLLMVAILAVGLSVLLNEVGLSMARVFDRALDWVVSNGQSVGRSGMWSLMPRPMVNKPSAASRKHCIRASRCCLVSWIWGIGLRAAIWSLLVWAKAAVAVAATGVQIADPAPGWPWGTS